MHNNILKYSLTFLCGWYGCKQFYEYTYKNCCRLSPLQPSSFQKNPSCLPFGLYMQLATSIILIIIWLQKPRSPHYFSPVIPLKCCRGRPWNFMDRGKPLVSNSAGCRLQHYTIVQQSLHQLLLLPSTHAACPHFLPSTAAAGISRLREVTHPCRVGTRVSPNRRHAESCKEGNHLLPVELISSIKSTPIGHNV